MTDNKYPILAIKGYSSSAVSWLKEEKNKNGGKPIQLQLYDKGYDIWLGNCRGNENSHFNEKFPENDESFERWDFSMAE